MQVPYQPYPAIGKKLFALFSSAPVCWFDTGQVSLLPSNMQRRRCYWQQRSSLYLRGGIGTEVLTRTEHRTQNVSQDHLHFALLCFCRFRRFRATRQSGTAAHRTRNMEHATGAKTILQVQGYDSQPPLLLLYRRQHCLEHRTSRHTS